MRLTVILPGDADLMAEVRRDCLGWVGPDVRIDLVATSVSAMPPPGRCDSSLLDSAFMREPASAVVEAAVQAAAGGSDGIYVCCAAEIGVEAAREKVAVPVVGGLFPALHMGLLLGRRVGVLCPPDLIAVFEALIARAGLTDRVRALPVSLDGGAAEVDALCEAARTAVERGEAEALVLTCTILFEQRRALGAYLAGHEIAAPIVDLTGAALAALQGLVRLSRSPSIAPGSPD
ncbi:aspartate/glutamate racemase family protein [Bailinhaonella thermotolerans]|uniref:aspartate/glutamate racemase family protein n=1 Tax=Bailinhaonella thermotolerans TaxID=1070861 RepID=UPI0011C372C9|nr:aspartate/glutamate racemase family protein [Bailinhaonella thermotolerans]